MLNRKNWVWQGSVLCCLLLISVAAALAQGKADNGQPTLYNRLGGLMPISVVVSDFIDAMVPDPFINQNPAVAEARHRVPAAYLKYQVTAQVCQATGGPCQYTGRNMQDSHVHLNITTAEWDRMVDIFKQVLAKHQVPGPEQKELLEIIDSTRSDIVKADMKQ